MRFLLFILLFSCSVLGLSVGVSPSEVIFDNYSEMILLQNPNGFDVTFELKSDCVEHDSLIKVEANSQEEVRLYLNGLFDKCYLYVEPKGVEVFPTIAVALKFDLNVDENKSKEVINSITGAVIGTKKEVRWPWLFVLFFLILFLWLLRFRLKNANNSKDNDHDA
jgi:hypothetical protein